MSAPTPQVPPRPARSSGGAPTLAKQDIPQIPPRPERRFDRSPSPNRYARSPLNEAPTSASDGKPVSSSQNLSAPDLPRRPPSVSLPSIGQEGNEYATLDDGAAATASATGSPEQHRNVAPDLPIHAPLASVPQSTAKSRIATVTRTDSSQAAAAGIGKSHDDEDEREHSGRSVRAADSSSRSHSALPSGTLRPQSDYDSEREHGIPSFGLTVPMYPNAGDVQAPSPSPFAQTHSPGIGFFNDGTQPASGHHHRKRSSRHEIAPPGSYGLHGHGLEPKDKFEKAWYQKHPEALGKTQGEYGAGVTGPRGEWALSSEDLNRLVHESTSRGIGFGTNPDMIGTPDEQIGYQASQEYASRMASPKPAYTPLNGMRKRQSSGAQAHAESPLRKTSFAIDESVYMREGGGSDNALESEAEDDVIHVNPPSRRASKYGGGGYDPPTEDLGPHGGNTAEGGGWIDERGYGVPILASDEVAKNSGLEHLQPAVSPEQERRGQEYFAGTDSAAEYPPQYQSGRRRSTSRPSSRPGSIHGFSGLSKVTTADDNEPSGHGTPLEEIEEYEPLFPDDDDKHAKPKTAIDQLKRPDLARHQFPSQDVWEDTPSSLQYTTTVEKEQEPEDKEPAFTTTAKPSSVFESPEAEQARMTQHDPVEDRANFLTESTKQFAKSHFKPGVLDDMPRRPGMKQRFPSRDIWEDTPDSMRLETTVNSPQMDEITSPPDAKPTSEQSKAIPGVFPTSNKPEVPARPVRSNLVETAQPEAPARSAQKTRPVPLADVDSNSMAGKQMESEEGSPTDRKAPAIPDRPKPQVPARPARPSRAESSEDAPLSKSQSAGSDGASSNSTVTSPPVPKAKPAVPSRPVGGKIAALKAGFLNDLNSRLQMGPQAPPKAAEPVPEAAVEEQAALGDARKGRARGPARRKPAANSSGAAEEGDAKGVSTSVIVSPWTVWEIDEDGHVAMSGEKSDKKQDLNAVIEENVAANTESAAPPSPESVRAEPKPMSPLSAALFGRQGNEESVSHHAFEAEKAEHDTGLGSSESAHVPLEGTAAAATAADGPTDSKSDMVSEKSVQTGQQDLVYTSPTGEEERSTVYLGGAAPSEGNVIVKDGVEMVGEMDGRKRMAETGHGM
ncbi:hypothetical protein LTR50_000306 [Elasticomyces elasticus]|nr:hypothetical protein LTR50_000306 [Elasticomyces elasticus]